MGGRNSVPFKEINISRSTVDYNNGIKKETSIKNNICSENDYKLDPITKNWILMKQDSITLQLNSRYGEFTIDENQVSKLITADDLSELDGPEINIKKENLPTSISSLNNKMKEYKMDYEKLDLINKYQENFGCIKLEESENLAESFDSEVARVKYYKSIIKCQVKSKHI
jgi:hypothetical protein